MALDSSGGAAVQRRTVPIAIVRELKGIWGLMGTLRVITQPIPIPSKVIREAVPMGLPDWDPPPPKPPLPPDEAMAQKAREVIGMGTVQELEAFDRFSVALRRITGDAPRNPRPMALPVRTGEESEERQPETRDGAPDQEGRSELQERRPRP